MEKLREIKAVIHDWDDTVVATFDPVQDIINNFAILEGLPTHERDSVARAWGVPLKRFLQVLWPNVDADYLHDRYVLSVPDGFKKPLLPGADKAILELREMGFTLGIISSNSRHLIIEDLDRIGLSPMIYHFVHGPDECKAHKPQPQVFDNAMELLFNLGIKESEVAYVGDDLRDFVTARDRGIIFFAVTSGFTTKEQFEEIGLQPGLILPTLAKLPDLLKTL